MIITRLHGGLGNQLFQYAAGKALAEKHNTGLLLDTTNYYLEDFRKFELNHFCVTSEIAEFQDIIKYCKFQASISMLQYFGLKYFPGSIKYKLLMYRNRFDIAQSFSQTQNHHEDISESLKKKPPRAKRIFNERYLNFDEEFSKIPDNTYLIGFWQSQRYFENIEPIIRKELQLKDLIENHLYIDPIKKTNSVSIHVRRGDKTTNSNFFPTELTYVEQATDFIKKHVENPYFFIFSDEIDWVKENLRINGNFLFINGTKPTEDLYYMSQCKHNIIAESSFSWWGAWLNNNSKKIVITPDPIRWVKNFSGTTDDLFPEGWIVLK